jgi:hypothetical protein
VADSQDCTENQSVYHRLGRICVMRSRSGPLVIVMITRTHAVGQGGTECGKTMFRIPSLR